ncbi:MAG: phosphodiester glycosidase family protein [Candidatus Magasanikbacteria bacterium]|nr:phosphodiester glycosidase family protein [Candidatus Magasanikbacteria bacterium]
MQKKYSILFFGFLISGIVFLYFFLPHKYTQHSIHDIYEYSEINFNTIDYAIAKIPPEHIASLHFYYKNEENQKFTDINHLKKEKQNLIFATNAGIFSRTYEPLGLYIQNDITISNINTSTGEGNFYLEPNGVFFIKKDEATIIETNAFQHDADIAYAIQSGPVLVTNNTIHPLFNKDSENKFIRNGVGIDTDGNIIFAISNTPVSFYEFASFFKEKLNCPNALYLDGAISEMYVPGYREHTKEKFGVIIGILDQ